VIHRDIKPHNLLLKSRVKARDGSRGQIQDEVAVKVLDFGLALLSAPTVARLTKSDAIMGTPQYMSPEQAQGKHVDARSDIYSLGITLYELLTGRVPFPGESAFTMIEGHVKGELSFPTEVFANVPHMFRELIAGMCAKAPDDRVPLKQVIEKVEDFLGVSRPAHTTPATREGPRTNLSPLPTSFVGREQEMQELRDKLAGARLITVMGPGGIGKTRFTREFGLSVAEEYPGGVWFCDLTEARSEAGICHGVGQGMDIPLTQADPIAQIHAALRMRGRLLIIFDNFEQVAQHAAATLGKWMQDAPEVQFIASSREPLHLDGEKTYPLEALALGSAEQGTAVQLFVDRASDVRSGFKLDDSNREAVQKIVQELDGIPLAIELAAARVSALSPQKILERLPKRFELLTSRRRDASAKQMTMLGAIEWSWNLLEPHEQLALAQCSVFRDGFFLDAAEAVIDLSSAGASPAALPLTMDVIESLVEKSLLRAYEVPQLPGETRYRMYETIRDFADRKMMNSEALGTVPGAAVGAEDFGELSRAGLSPSANVKVEAKEGDSPQPRGQSQTGPEAAEALRLRHAKHYVECAEALQSRISTHDGLNALNRIELEYDNLFAVQDGLEHKNPEIAARAILAAAAVLRIRGPWQPRIHRLERALQALGVTDPAIGARLLAGLAVAHLDCGNRAGMERCSAEAVAKARSLGDDRDSRSRLGDVLQIRAINHVRLGEFDAGFACLAERESIARELGDRAGMADTYNIRGLVHTDRDEYDAALACFVEEEAVHRDLGNRVAMGVSVGNRAVIHTYLGEHDAALACYSEAEAISRELGDRSALARNIGNRGNIHLSRGEGNVALACFFEAEMINRALGYHTGLEVNVGNRARCLRQIGMWSAALAAFEEWLALEKLIATGNANNVVFLGTFARTHQELAEAESAKSSLSPDARDKHSAQARALARQARDLAANLKITLDNPRADIREAMGWVNEILAARDHEPDVQETG
jgi:predicted ATPase